MVPFVISGEKAFVDSCSVAIQTYTPDAEIRYTNDGNEPESSSKLYTEPFTVYNSTNFKIKAFKKGMDESFTEEVSFLKIPYKRSITYTFPYSHLYTAGGSNGLIDGLHGEPNVFGGWHGFFGDDLEVIIDLGKPRSFSTIRTTFLQQFPSWIWLPSEVTYSISKDGLKFGEVHHEKNTVGQDVPDSFIKSFNSDLPETTARYIKVLAKNIGVCPPGIRVRVRKRGFLWMKLK